jgi:hypothetical protein
MVGLGAALGAAILLSVPLEARPVVERRTFVGHAYDLERGDLLYREVHQEEVLGDGGILLRTVYECPQGSTIAVREVDYANDPLAPRFRLDDLRGGYSEGLHREDGDLIVYRRLPDAPGPEERRIRSSGLLVADAGFDRLITTAWDRLVAGERVRADFVVPSRLRTLGLVATLETRGTLAGEPVVTFRMRFTNPLVRLLVGPTRVTYHAQQRVLMRYEGLSNLTGADGDTMRVRIDFPVRDGADGGDLHNAAREVRRGGR